jgi:uncharacterized protein
MFEFDPQKSALNKEKHGIDFVEAQHLWSQALAVEFRARSQQEVRYAIITEYQGLLWTAFYTLRRLNIRIISVRRSRQIEKDLYENTLNRRRT